jgi:hypothetical protein
MTKKAANYSATDIEQLLAGYDPKATEETRNAQVQELASDMGRKTASIIAKLVNLGVYVKKAPKAKDGTPSMSKSARVAVLAERMGVAGEVLESLEKANVNVVKLVSEWVEARLTAEHNLANVLDSVEKEFTSGGAE